MRIILAVVLVLLVVALVALGQGQGGLDRIGDVATLVLKPLAVPVVNLINQPAFAYVASALIFLSALGIVVWFATRILVPQLTGMRRAREEIEALRKTGPGDWLKACERIHGILKRHDALLPAWTLFAAEVVERRGIPERRFAVVVKEQTSIGVQARAAFLTGLPGYYTSVGLILTFVGLVVALYVSARGFRSGDMNEARQAIVQLLNASAFKFLSSVAALLGALMISLVHRYGTHALVTASAELAGEIDAFLQPIRPERRELTDDARFGELTAALAALTTELAATRSAVATLESALKERAP
jgi:hypothetical protein